MHVARCKWAYMSHKDDFSKTMGDHNRHYNGTKLRMFQMITWRAFGRRVGQPDLTKHNRV
jgi:hypothetical protein